MPTQQGHIIFIYQPLPSRRGINIYVWRYVCHNSSACHAYIMWAELGHLYFLYVPAVLNVVTTGNGTGTKKVLKWNRALGFGFEFSIQSSVYGTM